MCFSRRRAAPPPPPPPEMPARPPRRIDPEVRAARGKQRREAATRYGRRGTVLTGSRGVLAEANVQKKSLLGA